MRLILGVGVAVDPGWRSDSPPRDVEQTTKVPEGRLSHPWRWRGWFDFGVAQRFTAAFTALFLNKALAAEGRQFQTAPLPAALRINLDFLVRFWFLRKRERCTAFSPGLCLSQAVRRHAAFVRAAAPSDLRVHLQ